MANQKPINVFANFSAGLGIGAFLSLLLIAGVGSVGSLIAVFTILGSITAILTGIVGLAIARSTRKGAIAKSLAGGLLGLFSLIVLILATPDIRPVAARMKSSNNLKQIWLAVDAYHSTEKKLPSTIRDRGGKPLLSMRVLLLPYIEEEQLFREFHLGEPWDSPHNLALLDRLPETYRSPREKKSSGTTTTYYRFVTGPGTAFEREGMTFGDIKDGLSNTIFMLEAGDTVPWTKPDEWEYDPNKPLPPVGGIFGPPRWYELRRGHQNGANVLFGDGSVHFIHRNASEKFWRAIATRDGGEKVEWP